MNSLITDILDVGMAMYNWWNGIWRLFISTFKENEFLGPIIKLGAIIAGIIALLNWLLKR